MGKLPFHQTIQRAGLQRLAYMASHTTTGEMVVDAGAISLVVDAIRNWPEDIVVHQRGCRLILSVLGLPVDASHGTEGDRCTGQCGGGCSAESRLGGVVHDRLSVCDCSLYGRYSASSTTSISKKATHLGLQRAIVQGEFVRSVLVDMVALGAEDALLTIGLQTEVLVKETGSSHPMGMAVSGWCQAAASVYREVALVNEDLVPNRVFGESVSVSGADSAQFITHAARRCR